MFKKLKQKLEEGAEKVAKQVNYPSSADSSLNTSQPQEGLLVDVGQPIGESTPNRGLATSSGASVSV